MVHVVQIEILNSMKVVVFFFLLLFTNTEIQAQSLMTVGQIYNYDIGDIFIKSAGGIYAPPTYTTISITDKYFNTTLDSVVYIFNATFYTSPACAGCPPVYDTIYNDTIAYTNLNDTVGAGLGSKIHYWNMDCIDTAGYTGVWVDSVYYDSSFCSRLTTKISRMDNGPFLTDSCYWYFEPFYGYDEYGEGIGLTHHYYNTCSQGFPYCQEIGSLLFYKKGIDSCGLRPIIPLPASAEEYGVEEPFVIFPNPVADKAGIKFNREQNNSLFIMTNCFGAEMQRFIFSGSELSVNCEGLAEGIYFVSVISRYKKYEAKLAVKR